MRSRRTLDGSRIVFAGIAVAVFGSTAAVRAGEDPRTAMQFLQDLRDRGLHDLALDYIHRLRDDAPTHGRDQGSSSTTRKAAP